MADLIEIGVSFVDRGDGMKKAVSTVDRLEAKMTKLIKGLNSGTVSNDRFHKSMVVASRELKKNSDLVGNQAYNAMQKYVAAKKRSIQAEQDSARSIALETVALKSNKAALDAQRTATKANTASLNSFRLQNDAVYRSEQKLLALKKLLRTEVVNGNMTMREAAAVQMQYKRSLDSMGGGLVQAARKTNQLGVVTQQVGYQVGDFAVQVQGGQSAFVAFSQQATQLVGVLPLLSGSLGISAGKLIAISAGLGIAIPLLSALGGALFAAYNASDKTSEGVEDFEAKLKSAREEIKSTTEELELLSSGFQNVFVKTLSEQLDTATKKLDATKKALSELNSDDFSVSAMLGAIPFLGQATGSIGVLNEYKAALKDVTDASEELKVIQAQLATQSAIYANDQSQDLQSRLDILKLEVEYGEDNYRVREEIYLQERAAYELELQKKGVFEDTIKSILEQKDAVFELSEQLENSGNLAELIKDTMESIDLSGVIGQAEVLATKLSTVAEKAYAAMMAAYNNNLYASGVGRGRGGDPREFGLNRPDLVENTPEVQLADTASAVRDAANAAREKAANGAAKASDKLADALKREAEALKKQADELNLSADATAKYKDEYAKLVVLKEKFNLSDDAFSKEVAKLNEELANSNPVLTGFVDAFSNFLSTGANDFKAFANDIINMFKGMLIKMIAMAAKNKIMLSMGMGGSTLASSAAASAAGSTAGSAGMMAGIGAAAGTAGSALLGGGMSAFGMSAAAGGSIATGMAAMPAMAAIGAVAAPLLAVAAVFTFFKKKTKELDSGLNVTVKGMDTLVESFSKVQTSRFFGLSKKTSTNTTSASSEVANPVMNAASEIQDQVVKAAAALGVGSQAFKGFTYNFKLSLKGLTEEQAMSKINEELVRMGDSFASLIPGISSMAELTAIYQERLNLEIRLLQLQGNTQALRKIELNSVNDYNKSILKQIYATEDKIAADERAAQAAQVAAQKADELAQKVASILAQRVGLEDKLLQLQGNTNELRARELALLDPSNRALQKLIFTTEDKIVADQKAATIADERSNLEKQLLGLQGNTNELRKIELAGLDESNRALQEQIYAHENAAEAIKKLEDALNSLQENDFASMLDFQRARANTRMGLPVANNPTMPTSLAVGAAAPITNANSSTVSELRSMREDIKEMHKESMFAYSKLIKNGKDSRDTLRTWDVTGLPAERTA